MTRVRTRFAIVLFGAAIAVASACASGARDAPAVPGTLCPPNLTVLCLCPGSSTAKGNQTCARDGQSFTECLPCDGSDDMQAVRGVCGDGVVDPNEQCDHGASNGAPGDACTRFCRNKASGNGGAAGAGGAPAGGAGGGGKADGGHAAGSSDTGGGGVGGGAAGMTHVGGSSAAAGSSTGGSTASGGSAGAMASGGAAGAGGTTATCVSGASCDTGLAGDCAKGTTVCSGGMATCSPPSTTGCLCSHDKCTSGTALNPMCTDTCVQTICAADGFCCGADGGTWDDKCVEEVRTTCGNFSCAQSTGACSHNVCQTGGPLVTGCDSPPVVSSQSCATAVCKVDPYCCNKAIGAWDAPCVTKVGLYCASGNVPASCGN